MNNIWGRNIWRYQAFVAVLKITLLKTLFWRCWVVEDCHHLKSNNNALQKVIIKFSKQEDVYCVLKAKSSFKNIDVTENGIPPNTPIFVNQNLYSYCKFLWLKCKKPWLNKVIESYWVSKGSCRIRLIGNSVKIIPHIEDLKSLFPGYVILDENANSS